MKSEIAACTAIFRFFTPLRYVQNDRIDMRCVQNDGTNRRRVRDDGIDVRRDRNGVFAMSLDSSLRSE